MLSLFLPLLQRFCETGILKRTLDKGVLDIDLIDFRFYGIGRHKKVDDRPFGGGAGMLLRPEPVVMALESINKKKRGKVFMLSPRGTKLDQAVIQQLSDLPAFTLICGRYEGFDERVSNFVDDALSLGPFVMMGGEVAAMAIIESVARLVPGVLHNQNSVLGESFSGNFLEHPQYTQPGSFRGLDVPDVLRSGDHKKILEWRDSKKIKLEKRSHE